MNTKKMDFTYIVSEGASYNIGRSLGTYFKNDPAFLAFMTSPFMGQAKLNQRQINKAMEFFARYCPGINEEIAGFSHSVGANPEEIVYYFSFIQPPGHHCSQAVILPSISENGHTFHIRSYEWGWEEDQHHMLFTTRTQGNPGHIGFALQLFGRFDGINEHGLCITTTSGVIGMPILNDEGFVFPGVVRTVLDQCSSVDEAVAVIQEIPISDYRNFLLSDSRGNAAVVEVACSRKEVKLIREPSPEQFLVSMNHYDLPPMKDPAIDCFRNSLTRSWRSSQRLQEKVPVINQAVLKELLTDKYPDGLCFHHYREGFGTLWAMLFDVTNQKVEVCFGSPQVNEWRSFSLKDPLGKTNFQAVLPDEPASSDFWEKLP